RRWWNSFLKKHCTCSPASIQRVAGNGSLCVQVAASNRTQATLSFDNKEAARTYRNARQHNIASVVVSLDGLHAGPFHSIRCVATALTMRRKGSKTCNEENPLYS